MEYHFQNGSSKVQNGLYLSRSTSGSIAYLEPVLNADETTLRVLKIKGKPVKKKGQMWIVCTGASAKLLIAVYTYRDNRSKVTAEELLAGKGIGYAAGGDKANHRGILHFHRDTQTEQRFTP